MDVIQIGYPCKSISSQNSNPASFRDRSSVTGSGYHSLVQYVDYARPSIIVLENVRSLASRRRQFRDECPLDIQNKAMSARGYNHWFEVTNSAQYGLAHNRTRVWVIYMKFYLDKFFW